jgi:sulfur relay (sulfurtransferase) DsrF/TusC family protein
MKILSIVTTGYRATLEEQDDTVLWLTSALRGAGCPVDVLLRGSAVNYACKAQDASGLSFGDRKQTQPPKLAEDLSRLLGKGATIHVVQDDLGERGLERNELVDGLRFVARRDLATLLCDYDKVWSW